MATRTVPEGAREQVLQAARELKHQAFLINKRVKRTTFPHRLAVKDALFRAAQSVRPYRFSADRYPGEFVVKSLAGTAEPAPVPRTIYCFWTGDNPMSDNRLRGLASLQTLNPEVNVVLVNPANLDEFLLTGHPLHTAYERLSLVHKSDYLRCYFMNLHGGGYADVKTYSEGWGQLFDQLDAAKGKVALGYTELSSHMAAQIGGPLGRDNRQHYTMLIGAGAFICRPQTPFTREWYAELLARMDAAAGDLASAPGDERGANPGYPIRWTGIHGDIYQPLCLKYSAAFVHDDRIKPSFQDYK